MAWRDGVLLGLGLVCGVLLAPGGRAQSTAVWPAAYAGRAGEGLLNTPFSVAAGLAYNRSRTMVILDGASLPFRAGSVITQIAFRRDSRYATTGYGPISGGWLRAYIGPTLASPDQIDTSFFRTWSGLPMKIFDNSFVLPGAPAPGAALPPFSLSIPFNLPWTYQGGNLALDLRFEHPSPPVVWRCDAMAVPTQRHGTHTSLGGGCQGTNEFTPHAYPFVQSAVPGREMVIRLDGAVSPANPWALENVAFNWLGVSRSSFAGVPLPFDLAPAGFPAGCRLYTEMALFQAVATGNPSVLFTRAEARWPVPADPALAAATLYTQWMCVDTAQRTPMWLTVSDGQAITLGVPDPNPRRLAGRTLWRYGATGWDSENGSASGMEGAPILRFTGTLR